MFTGIIETTGQLRQREQHGEDQSLIIQSDTFDFSTCQLGDSIAVNGVCLTAVELGQDFFRADVSAETLQLTTLNDLPLGAVVNLEAALTLVKPLGGHLVSGHVDGIGRLCERFPDGRSERLIFAAPDTLMRYIAKKGSICIDGISLTVNAVENNTFHVNIVPHTMQRTALGSYEIGQAVNLEVDLLARYLERLLQASGEANDASGLTEAKLRAFGF